MYDSDFQKRIQYQGDPVILLKQVSGDYDLGDYQSYSVVSIGYEDYNLILKASKGNYFVKCFASFRSDEDCKRYIDIMLTALKMGVNHPKLYKSNQGYLHTSTLDGQTTRLCVLEHIEGDSFYSLKQQPTEEELMFLAKQAALINQINIHPPVVYDSWACVNFLKEFKEKKQYLASDDVALLEPLAEEFEKYKLDDLPHCFVHGDIINTNLIRSKNGQIYVFDFSVANWYPRIQELAVLFCDLYFNEKDPSKFPTLFNKGLRAYQEINPLSEAEVAILPLYTKVAHAMHVVCATYEREVNANNSKENDFWITLGRAGLRYSLSLWKNKNEKVEVIVKG